MARNLTSKQRDFIRLVGEGYKPGRAAKMSGYRNPAQDAYDLMRNPRVLAAVQERRQAAIQGDMAHLALEAMRDLMKKGPAAQRFQAARWTLENAGHKGASSDLANEKPLDEMNPAELADAVRNGMQALTELAGQLQGHHIIDGQARRLLDVDAIEAEPIEHDETPDFLQ